MLADFAHNGFMKMLKNSNETIRSEALSLEMSTLHQGFENVFDYS